MYDLFECSTVWLYHFGKVCWGVGFWFLVCFFSSKVNTVVGVGIASIVSFTVAFGIGIGDSVVFIVTEFPVPVIAAVVRLAPAPVPVALAVVVVFWKLPVGLLLVLLLPGSVSSKALSMRSGSRSWRMSYLFTRARLIARALFASSNCCLRWSSCADSNPSSGVVAVRAFPLAIPVSIPVSIPFAFLVLRGLAPGVTRLDPLGSFP